MTKQQVSAIIFAWACALTSVGAQGALVLDATFVDTAAGTWTATQKGVMNQAITDWQNVISGVSDGMGGSDSVTVTFDVDFTNAGSGGYLGQWSGGFSAFFGADIRPWDDASGSYTMNHSIHFNADFLTGTNQLWFDATPGDDGSDKAFADYDALSVARHEIGHMLGFTGLYRDDFNLGTESFPWQDLIVGGVFDPGGINELMEAGDPGHVDAPLRLMDTTLSNAEFRVDISSTEAQMLALGYGYTLVSAVPEPSAFLALAVLGGGAWVRKRRKAAKRL